MNISTKKTYVRTDAWRGYEKPIYSVIGWNDTGTWSDSPCNSVRGLNEARLAKTFLRKHKIHFKTVACRSSNVFCLHRYLVVSPSQFELAKRLLAEWYETIKDKTYLLYLA